MPGRSPPRKPEDGPELFLRLDLAPGTRLGPGKVRLLELIGSEGSISAAARKMKMSYRRAWLLVAAMNEAFREPLVTGVAGGRHGGGAQVTPLGASVVGEYRRIERTTARAAEAGLDRIRRQLRNGPR